MEGSHGLASYTGKPFSGRRFPTAVALALGLMCLAGCAANQATAPTATLAEVKDAPHDGADVIVAGHVTYVAPEQRLAFIQDAAHGLAVELGPQGFGAAPGDYVTLAAHVQGVRALARLTRPRVLAAQRSSLPDPPFADPDAMASGALNATRVKLAARVQGATPVGKGLSLTLTSRGYELLAYLRDAGSLTAADLIGAEIRLRGVVEPGVGTADLVPGARVVAGKATDIEFVHRVDAGDPSPAIRGPLTSVAAVRELPTRLAGRGLPVQVRARVTYLDRGWTVLFVQDRSAGIFVYFSQLTHPMPDCGPGRRGRSIRDPDT